MIGRAGETRAGARSPTGKVTDVKQLVRHDAATTAATVTNNHLVVCCIYLHSLPSKLRQCVSLGCHLETTLLTYLNKIELLTSKRFLQVNLTI